MSARMDLTGKRYGKLVVLEEAEQRGYNRYWLCRCDCGTETIVHQGNLRRGHTTSCSVSCSTTTHGLSGHPLYHVWRNIKQRCCTSSCRDYKYYGGRGIEMCDKWKDDPVDFAYYCVTNGWEQGLDCDRIDTNGNYEPGNMQFITRSEHAKKSCDYRYYGIN